MLKNANYPRRLTSTNIRIHGMVQQPLYHDELMVVITVYSGGIANVGRVATTVFYATELPKDRRSAAILAVAS